MGSGPPPHGKGHEREGGWFGQTRLAPDQLSRALPQEPYLQSQCGCCSYSLDPESPVRILTLRCPGGRTEPVVLPAIRSCQCSACLGGSGRGQGQVWGGRRGLGGLSSPLSAAGAGPGRAFGKATRFPTGRPRGIPPS